MCASECVWVIRACTFMCQIKRNGGTRWYKANYSSFSVSDGAGKYRLSVSGYSGDAGDAMVNPSSSLSACVANGMMFTTQDQDNDEDSVGNVATLGDNGGWWFKMCSNSILNTNGGGTWEETGSEERVSDSRMLLQAPGSVTFILFFLFLCLFVCLSCPPRFKRLCTSLCVFGCACAFA